MKIVVSGSSGLVGSALVESFTAAGHHVVCLVRSEARPGQAEISWDPASGRLDAAPLEGLDAVVHLAGESIAQGRWTRKKRARIRDSRVDGTQLLSRTLAGLAARPGCFASASAIGYYGNRGDEQLDEASPPGTGFLPGVCRDWEAATQPAGEAGIRVVQLRFGMILAPQGGALAKMLGPFRWGLGGRLAGGRQYVSWITLDDVLGAIHHALGAGTVHGPINVVSPQPVTNRQFTRTLGRVLHRPTLLPAPGFALRLVLGPMADEVLLASTRVAPRRLLDSGYEFRDAELEPALHRLLAR